MIARLVDWWGGLSRRERVLVGIMFALLAIVVVWLGIARPVESGLKSAVERQGAALDRNVAVKARVRALKTLPAGPGAGPAAPVSQLVGESASEAGLTLDRNQEQGPDRVDIAIATVRPTAFFGWIAQLEAQGVVVETMTAQPGTTAGTLQVEAIFKARGK